MPAADGEVLVFGGVNDEIEEEVLHSTFLSDMWSLDLGARAGTLSSIRQHTSAYVSIRQHMSAYVRISQHTSAYVSIRQHTSAYVSIRQHTSAEKEYLGSVTQEDDLVPSRDFLRYAHVC